jgi:MerR family transcriptional regulator/heat shock protein HspR
VRTREPDEVVEVEAVADLVGMPAARVRHYLRVGLVTPRRTEGQRPVLGPAELARLRRIRRLSDDLGLNLAGVEVALHLLDVIEALEARRR